MPDRLSALDASFLYVEDPATPMHVGGVAIFERPRGGFGYDQLLALVGQRLGYLAHGVATARPARTDKGRTSSASMTLATAWGSRPPVVVMRRRGLGRGAAPVPRLRASARATFSI